MYCSLWILSVSSLEKGWITWASSKAREPLELSPMWRQPTDRTDQPREYRAFQIFQSMVFHLVQSGVRQYQVLVLCRNKNTHKHHLKVLLGTVFISWDSTGLQSRLPLLETSDTTSLPSGHMWIIQFPSPHLTPTPCIWTSGTWDRTVVYSLYKRGLTNGSTS